MNKTGLLISIEGIDGSGKSSLAKKITETLKSKNFDALLTQEPGGTILGKKLREILHEEKESTCNKSEFLLFAADRAQHFEEIIVPELEKGKIIISDRLNDASTAYQGYGRCLDLPIIHQTNQWVMQNIKPDLIFYIKLDLQTAMNRILQRGQKLTSFEKEQELFWQRVIKGYEIIFKSRNNVIPLNGAETIDSLCTLAVKEIKKLVNKHACR